MSRENSPAPRVLVTDDELLIRWSLAQALTAAGADVTEAADGHSAIAAVRAAADPFDVAVLDVRLPDNSGLGLLAAIRALSPGTRVVLMTACDTPELRSGASALGAADVVGKPFDLHRIAELVFHPPAAA
jgi:DNA-binding NtrC family response regulator